MLRSYLTSFDPGFNDLNEYWMDYHQLPNIEVLFDDQPDKAIDQAVKKDEIDYQ